MATFRRFSMLLFLMVANPDFLNVINGLPAPNDDTVKIEKDLVSLLHRLTGDVNSIQETKKTEDVVKIQIETGAEARSRDCVNGQAQTLTSPRGTVQSPGYNSGSYPNNAACGWYIQAASNQVIEVTIDEMNIENEQSCSYDSLTAYDGSTTNDQQLGKYCGKRVGSVRSSGNGLLLVLISDGSVNNGRFAFSWSFVDKPGSGGGGDGGDACVTGQVTQLNSPSGTIKSQGYNTNTYPNNANCRWRINAPNGMVVNLRVYNVKIEQSGGCVYDSLTLYDGSNENTNRLAQYCGENGGTVQTTGNTVFIVFKSDSSVNTGRFAIDWTSTSSSGNGAPPGSSTCGQPVFQPNVNFNSRIVGGTEARAYSYPWQCSVQVTSSNGQSYFQCGGSVISRNFILTAAHCFFDENDRRLPDSGVRIDCGIFNIRTKAGSARQSSDGTVTIHENYDPSGVNNDIAVIRLNNELTYTDYVSPICLPSQDLPANTKCVAAGWGDTKGTGSNTNLRQVVLPILSQRSCNVYRSFNPTTMMCAGILSGGKDTCQGDSGGPLVCPVNGKWYQPGVVSYGSGCAQPNAPGVYARVVGFLGWIQQKTGVGPTTRMDELETEVNEKEGENNADELLDELRNLIDKLDKN